MNNRIRKIKKISAKWSTILAWNLIMKTIGNNEESHAYSFHKIKTRKLHLHVPLTYHNKFLFRWWRAYNSIENTYKLNNKKKDINLFSPYLQLILTLKAKKNSVDMCFQPPKDQYNNPGRLTKISWHCNFTTNGHDRWEGTRSIGKNKS